MFPAEVLERIFLVRGFAARHLEEPSVYVNWAYSNAFVSKSWFESYLDAKTKQEF